MCTTKTIDFKGFSENKKSRLKSLLLIYYDKTYFKTERLITIR